MRYLNVRITLCIIISIFTTLLWSAEINSSLTDSLNSSKGSVFLHVNKTVADFGYKDGMVIHELDGIKKKGFISTQVETLTLFPGTHTIQMQYYIENRSVGVVPVPGGVGAFVGVAVAVIAVAVIRNAISGEDVSDPPPVGYSAKRTLDFTVEAGKEYQVKAKYASHELFVCWIEDAQTGEVVSKLHRESTN